MAPTTISRVSNHASTDDDRRWQAVTRRDAGADGHFVYAVRTTGVYCRPSCPARRARRENVEFHPTPHDAERAGFRACQRCGPSTPAAAGAGAHAASVARACRLIAAATAEGPPRLAALAHEAGLSVSHFHRTFKSLTGLTPKAYAAAHRARRVREALSRDHALITSAIYDAGFESAGRFYANSSEVLGMKPASFRARGAGATIRFAAGECWLGSILVAATDVGVCAISIGDDPAVLVRELQDRFSNATLIGAEATFEEWVARVVGFVRRPSAGLHLPLDIQGTAFQQRVWQALCRIPCGQTRSYTRVARDLGAPNAVRAVATACAANPLAVAIPCHRVVRTDGSLSGYRWGIDRKARLLDAERAAPKS